MGCGAAAFASRNKFLEDSPGMVELVIVVVIPVRQSANPLAQWFDEAVV